jgi:Superinfection immunity protein
MAFVGLLIIAALLGAYFAPWIVAAVRHLPNRGPIIVVNIFLGWTFIGWVVALAMACRSVPASAVMPSAADPPGAWPAVPPAGPPRLPPVTGPLTPGERIQQDGETAS